MASQLVAGRVKGLQPHATGQDVPLREDDPKSGQDEMALKRKSTKTRAEREFLKLPEVNFISSITVLNGITTLPA
jgi:hypothetical protein